jgi:hypothetical protein
VIPSDQRNCHDIMTVVMTMFIEWTQLNEIKNLTLNSFKIEGTYVFEQLIHIIK